MELAKIEQQYSLHILVSHLNLCSTPVRMCVKTSVKHACVTHTSEETGKRDNRKEQATSSIVALLDPGSS